jgi:hypothetical protein
LTTKLGRRETAVTNSASDDEGKGAQPGALVSRIAIALGIAWIAGCGLIAFALLGATGIAALTPIQGGALVAAALLPALMAWFAGAAAREAARARAEAQRLADAADRLLNPQQSAEEAGRKLALSVRSEISSLDHALEKTLQRLKEVEGVVTRQAETVDQMAGTAKESAGAMITGMEREREELMKISRDLNNQAQSIGSSISRHTQSISEAARQAEAEVRAADQALDHRLTSFGAAAALITDRTQALSGAAQSSADSALRLEQALSNALDVLAKATHLTDAARQSAEAATLAANSTAGAVRDTTSRAIDDAKRAADLIRGEAVNVEREAAVALERLRDAAEAARAAAIGARSAVEDEEPPARAPRQRSSPPADVNWRDEPDPLEAAPPPRHRREAARDESPFGEPPPRGDRPAIQGGEWTWRDLLSSVDEGEAAKPKPGPSRSPARRAPAEDAVTRLTHQISDPRGPTTTLPVAAMVAHAGMRLDEVFSASGLERVAQRARSGTQARRRAVKDAAPDAVQRMSEHLARDGAANQEAMRFLRNEGAHIAELLSRGRASMNAEATRAFLLIDSAAG